MSAALTVSAHHPTADVVLPVADLGNRAEWLQARRQGVTATDMRVLMNYGYAGETVFGRWLEKVEPPADDEDADMPLRWRLGHSIEQAAADAIASKLAIRLARVGMLRHKTTKTLLASPDRSTSDGGLEETKWTSLWYLRTIADAYPDAVDQWTNLDGWTLPPAWRVQAQHQLLVSGRTHCYVGAIIAETQKLTVWTVTADLREQDILREVADMFWTHVITGEAPPVEWDNLTKAELEQRWPKAEKASVLADDVDEVRSLLVHRSRMKSDLDGIDLRLKAIAGDADEVVDETGKKIYSYGNRTRRSFKVERLQVAHPKLDLSEFYDVTSYRQIHVAAAPKPKKTPGLSTAPLVPVTVDELIADGVLADDRATKVEVA